MTRRLLAALLAFTLVTGAVAWVQGTRWHARYMRLELPEVTSPDLRSLFVDDAPVWITLNAGGRLLTFCFPGTTTVAVLHEHEPSTGLRDKITLIARELARMLG